MRNNISTRANRDQSQNLHFNNGIFEFKICFYVKFVFVIVFCFVIVDSHGACGIFIDHASIIQYTMSGFLGF